MNVRIQVIATATETKPTAKGSYQQLEVTYKDLDKNKVASKKIMSFSKPEVVFKTMALAKATDVYDIELVKNESSGYWDWTNATKSSGDVASSTQGTQQGVRNASGTAQPSATKGGWETPEERAKKQIYIVRQSSLSTAVEALSVGAKTVVKAEDLIEYARKLETFVFATDDPVVVTKKDVGGIEGLEEDLPY